MKKLLLTSLCLLWFSYNIGAQAFVRAGMVSFNPNVDEVKLNIKTRSIPSYYLGGGLEAKILKIFLLEIGANYYNLKVDVDAGSDTQELSGAMVGLPVLLKINPVKYFNAGVGVMPSAFINQNTVTNIYYKKYDLSGTAKVEVKPIKQISIELAYTFGFIPSELVSTDAQGVEEILKSHQSFYNLGLKYNF